MKSTSIRSSSCLLGSALLVTLAAGCNRSDTAAAPVAAAASAAAPAAAPAPTPVAATADAEMYVDAPPPPPQEEVMVASPGPGFTWVAGYWGWEGGRRDWVRGHWERPPHEHAQWVQPRWEHRGRGYVFVKGFWR